MFHWITTGLGGFILLGYLATTLEFIRGNQSIRKLCEIALVEPSAHFNLPRVSVVIPARNEAKGIEAALESVLRLDYPDYELIILNDRSTDGTGAILEEMALTYPQLKVINIQKLPNGWLGKNYALWKGAQMASGDLLLFTDADVVFKPSALRRAVHYLQSEKLDHLAAMPGLISQNFDLSVFMGAFSVFFCLYSRPWNARKHNRKDFIGTGAFNLIRKTVYEAIGTHQSIAMRPDDDMKLGKRVKFGGFKQDLCDGSALLQVEWYHSLNGMVEGLMKNAFAGVDYNLPYTLLVVSLQFLFSVWPVLALFVTDGLTWWLYACVMVLMQVLCLSHVLRYRLNPLSGPFFPISALLVIYIILRATTLTLLNNGIHWRGTHYPLSALKANRV